MCKNKVLLNISFYLGLLGCFALIGGVFAPLANAPFIGSINYIKGASSIGIIILVLAGISLILVLKEIYKGLYLTGFLTSVIIFVTYIVFQERLKEPGAFFGFLGDLVADTVKFQWGWILLLIGVIMLFISAKMA